MEMKDETGREMGSGNGSPRTVLLGRGAKMVGKPAERSHQQRANDANLGKALGHYFTIILGKVTK